MKRLIAIVTLGLMVGSVAWADSLELKNGSVIKGRYMGGDESTVTFQVGSTVQKYNVGDIEKLTFEAAPKVVKTPPAVYENSMDGPMLAARPKVEPAPQGTVEKATLKTASSYVTVPAGTQMSVRMIDGIDSAENQIGDKFHATLEEALVVDGATVVDKGSDVWGRLTQAKEAGRVSGASELRLELTELVVNGKSVPLVTGEYSAKGEARGGNTAKKAATGAAIGAVIGAIAGGGKGAAIGAGVGGAAGTSINVVTKGEQVKVPSETVLEFRLMQPVNLPGEKVGSSLRSE